MLERRWWHPFQANYGIHSIYIYISYINPLIFLGCLKIGEWHPHLSPWRWWWFTSGWNGVMILQSPSEPIKSMNIHSLAPAKNSHKNTQIHPKSMSIDPKSIKIPSKTYQTSIKPCKIHQNSIKTPSNIHQTLPFFQILPVFFRLFQDLSAFWARTPRPPSAVPPPAPRGACAASAPRSASARQRCHFFRIFFWGFSNGCSDIMVWKTIWQLDIFFLGVFQRFQWLYSDIMVPYGYGSIPIHTILRCMNIHLPAILRFSNLSSG